MNNEPSNRDSRGSRQKRLSAVSIAFTLLCGAAHGAPGAGAAGDSTRLPVAFAKASFIALEVRRRYDHYIESLERCAGLQVTNTQGVSWSNAGPDLLSDEELLENLKAGRLAFALLPVGLTVKAAELGLGTPIASRGNTATGVSDSYQAQMIVRADSPYRKPTDLAGQKIAHTSASSFSGNLVQRALLPTIGLQPDANYTVVFSKGHERSVMGTYYGFWQGAVVASDVYDRMLTAGDLKESDMRTLWRSERFPIAAWFIGKRVPAPVAQRVRECTFKYRLPEAARKALNGMDGFVPIDYERDFQAVRQVLRHAEAAKQQASATPPAQAASTGSNKQ